MKKNSLLFFFILYLLFGCNSDNNYPKEGDIIDPPTIQDAIPLDSLKKRIIENGDIKAYSKLKNLYWETDGLDNPIYYSMLLANNYQYAQAYYDIYAFLKHLNNTNDKGLNEVMLNFMIDCLKKATELGHNKARNDLGKLYLEGKYVPQDTLLGKKLTADYLPKY